MSTSLFLFLLYYEVTYKKTADGKTSWTDNQGNSNDGSKQTGRWISPSVYYMNDLAKGDGSGGNLSVHFDLSGRAASS